MVRLCAAAFLAALAGFAHAAPFQNGSFEAGGGCGNVYDVTGTTLAGWTVYTGNVDWESSLACGGWQPSDGNFSLDLVGQGFGFGGIQQTFDTVPGVTYQVSFDLAGNPGAGPTIKPLTVTVGSDVHSYTFDTTGKSGTAMGWTTQVFTFVATSSSATISFLSDVSAAGGTLNAGAALDNVRIIPLAAGVAIAAVPLTWAPGMAAALLLAATLALRRRRRY
jgi:choice-of-anchor C domain-containing protein